MDLRPCRAAFLILNTEDTGFDIGLRLTRPGGSICRRLRTPSERHRAMPDAVSDLSL